MSAEISRRSLMKTSALSSLALASSAFTLPFSQMVRAAEAPVEDCQHGARCHFRLDDDLRAAAILRAACVTFNTTPFAIISVLALIACAGVIVLQGASLASIHSSVQQASALIPDYASLQVWRVVLLCAGLGCWLCPLIRRHEPHVAGLVLGIILILGGEMIGRALFYGLHMTPGMAVAG